MSADVDELIEFKRHEWSRLANTPDLLAFLMQLRRTDFDCVLDFQGLFRSGVCTYFANAPKKVGFADAREGAGIFYKRKIVIEPAIKHAVERNIALLDEALGETHEYCTPNFHRNDEAEQKADAILEQHNIDAGKNLVAIGPATRWESKSWPPEFFAETIKLTSQKTDANTVFWLLGTKEEVGIGETIIAQAGAAHLHNFMGKTDLPTMMALLKRSKLMLTNDSGPMHIAAALELPTIALFGPTDPDKTGPYGRGHRVFRTAVECAPCFKRLCPLPEQLCRYDVISAAKVSDCIAEML
jgi:heptosyltransferase-1